MAIICRRLTIGRFGASLAFVGTLLAAHAASADEVISACVNPAGHVRLAPDGACHGQEQLVTWTTGAVSAPTVVDANGTRVGFFTGSTVLVNIGDDWFTTSAGRAGFTAPSFVTFAYLTQDCSGQPYTSANANALVASAVVLSHTALFPDLDAAPVVITGTPTSPGMYWVKQVSGPPSNCVGIPVAFGQVVLLPIKSIDVSGFVPPFRIK